MDTYHVHLAEALAFLRRTAAAALMVLATRLDPSSERRVLAQGPEVIEAEKGQEDVPAVQSSPVAVPPASENVPVDLLACPVSNPFPPAPLSDLTRPPDPWY